MSFIYMLQNNEYDKCIAIKKEYQKCINVESHSKNKCNHIFKDLLACVKNLNQSATDILYTHRK